MFKNVLIALCAALVLLFSGLARAVDPIYTSFFSNKALSGYDPVAYFTDAKPAQGSSDYSFDYLGATWFFVSSQHRDLFIANPAKYAPQYGGYCAWAVAQGKSASGDPEFWKIVDGKLYLNYDDAVQKKWEADIPGFIKAADVNWPKVLNE